MRFNLFQKHDTATLALMLRYSPQYKATGDAQQEKVDVTKVRFTILLAMMAVTNV
jgi:hypothetical protein